MVIIILKIANIQTEQFTIKKLICMKFLEKILHTKSVAYLKKISIINLNSSSFLLEVDEKHDF